MTANADCGSCGGGEEHHGEAAKATECAEKSDCAEKKACAEKKECREKKACGEKKECGEKKKECPEGGDKSCCTEEAAEDVTSASSLPMPKMACCSEATES